jgi:phosphopantothenoylcysteine decarboxylase / phosphopantothenate---cysteine ligase
VANDVTTEGSGFEGETNIATILDRSGKVQTLPMMTKDELADRIFDYLHALKTARL